MSSQYLPSQKVRSLNRPSSRKWNLCNNLIEGVLSGQTKASTRLSCIQPKP